MERLTYSTIYLVIEPSEEKHIYEKFEEAMAHIISRGYDPVRYSQNILYGIKKDRVGCILQVLKANKYVDDDTGQIRFVIMPEQWRDDYEIA